MFPAVKDDKAESAREDTLRLDAFFDAVRDSNPFIANRITEPSRYDVDVPAIHADSFDRLVRLAEQARSRKSAIGAILLGGAGVGKSHLLSRLYRWANEVTEDGKPRACYVYLHNILADPDRLPRYLLKYVVSRLAEGGHRPMHQTPLYRLVDQAIRHAMTTAGDKMSNLQEILDAYRAYFGTSAGSRDVFEVFFQFVRHARPGKADDPTRRRLASEAVAWLSGNEIDPDAARLLGLKVDGQEPVMLLDDQEVEQVLLALAQLAFVSKQSFILCIDQVENLDPDKLKPLARFLHALLDHASNILLIASGVKQTLLAYWEDGIIPEAAWDRIAQFKVELKRISRGDARKILEARLERFHDSFLEVEAVSRHLHEDTLFPLGRFWLERQLGEAIEIRPRDILTWAREAWEEEQAKLARLGGKEWICNWPHDEPIPPPPPPPSIDEMVDRKISEHVAQRRLEPGSLPPDAGNLAGLVESLLEQCRGEGLPYTFRGVERMKKKGPKLPPYDLLVRERRESDGREVTTGVLFVTNVGNSATAALRRLLEDDQPPDHRLLVTDEERRPLKVGQQGLEYCRDLKKLGPVKFEHLKIDFEQYAGLDALREVVGMAKSGDLEIEVPRGTIRPVTEAEVVASHHRQDRYRRHPLLRPLLTEAPSKAKEKKTETIKLDEKDVKQFVMAQLAWQMGSTVYALAKGYVAVMPAPKVAP
ncbi:MAG: hypothetical protein JO116_25535, partial [Planctomycetaceae bacterium]|nr:hypothetical protein [Planctomycetaceae bacterium]